MWFFNKKISYFHKKCFKDLEKKRISMMEPTVVIVLTHWNLKLRGLSSNTNESIQRFRNVSRYKILPQK